MVSNTRIDVAPDPSVWFLGPSDECEFDEWFPKMHNMLMTDFGIKPDELEADHFLAAMLERIGREEFDIPYQVIRWLDINDVPFVAFFGLGSRSDFERSQEQYLEGEDIGAVEKPILENIAGADGVKITRSIVYGQDESGILVEARYLIDTAHPDVVAMVETNPNRNAGPVIAALDDLDAFARAIQIVEG